ncbi:MAG TPA: hypothetical protein PK468_23750, partial [Candidatus Hydrogenedentes bacterium]|nr:hypothetical protein [Candidatus Hydrogenedentota bacterium]
MSSKGKHTPEVFSPVPPLDAWPRRHAVLVCVGLVITVACVYGQTAWFDFVTYDDQTFLTQNRHVATGLSVENFRWAFTTRDASNFFPLTWLSHMADFEVFGARAGGHHLVNVLLHALNAVALYLLLQSLTRAPWRSALVAALFALHPLHVEAVAWISSRKDVLSTLFGLSATAAYARYARRGHRRAYAIALVFLTLGLMAKTMLVTLPAVWLLLDAWPLERWSVRGNRRRLVIEKMPLFAVGAAFAAVALVANAGNDRIGATYSWAVRAGAAIIAYARYLLLTVWPSRLSVLNAYPGDSIDGRWVALSAASLAAITVVAVFLRRRAPYVLVGWLWFAGMLVPVCGLVQVHAEAIAHRYTYLPHVGLFIAFAWGMAELATRARVPRAVCSALAVAALAAIGACAYVQTGYWRDSETLFRHAVAVEPRNPEAHLALGNALADAGDFEAAAREYETVMKVDAPQYQAVLHDALNNWGVALYARAQDAPDDAPRLLREACAKYEAALAINAELARTWSNWGNALAALAERADGAEADALFDQAYEKYRAAVAADAQFADANAYWSDALLAQAQGKRDAEAEALFAKVLDKAEAALTADPRHYRALFNAGVALLLRAAGEEGEDARALLERAEARFLAAEGQRPGSAAYNMACVEARLGDEAACLRWL